MASYLPRKYRRNSLPPEEHNFARPMAPYNPQWNYATFTSYSSPPKPSTSTLSSTPTTSSAFRQTHQRIRSSPLNNIFTSPRKTPWQDGFRDAKRALRRLSSPNHHQPKGRCRLPSFRDTFPDADDDMTLPVVLPPLSDLDPTPSDFTLSELDVPVDSEMDPMWDEEEEQEDSLSEPPSVDPSPQRRRFSTSDERGQPFFARPRSPPRKNEDLSIVAALLDLKRSIHPTLTPKLKEMPRIPSDSSCPSLSPSSSALPSSSAFSSPVCTPFQESPTSLRLKSEDELPELPLSDDTTILQFNHLPKSRATSPIRSEHISAEHIEPSASDVSNEHPPSLLEPLVMQPTKSSSPKALLTSSLLTPRSSMPPPEFLSTQNISSSSIASPVSDALPNPDTEAKVDAGQESSDTGCQEAQNISLSEPAAAQPVPLSSRATTPASMAEHVSSQQEQLSPTISTLEPALVAVEATLLRGSPFVKFGDGDGVNQGESLTSLVLVLDTADAPSTVEASNERMEVEGQCDKIMPEILSAPLSPARQSSSSHDIDSVTLPDATSPDIRVPSPITAWFTSQVDETMDIDTDSLPLQRVATPQRQISPGACSVALSPLTVAHSSPLSTPSCSRHSSVEREAPPPMQKRKSTGASSGPTKKKRRPSNAAPKDDEASHEADSPVLPQVKPKVSRIRKKKSKAALADSLTLNGDPLPCSRASSTSLATSPDEVHFPEGRPYTAPELLGLIVETLALARASSLTLPELSRALARSHEDTCDQVPTSAFDSDLMTLLDAGVLSGVFGLVPAPEGGGRHVQRRWFYVPEQDPDRERAAVVGAAMPARRSEARRPKRYYWKPLGKISRWDPEDAI